MRKAWSVVCLLGALVFGLSAGVAAGDEAPVKSVRVSEQKGLERTGELVSVPLAEGQGPFAVVDADGKAVPSQVVGAGEGRVIFFAADVPAKGSRVYRIIHAQASAPEKPLQIAGKTLEEEVSVTSRYYEAKLMPKSGAFSRVALASDPEKALYNTFGPVHWNPGVVGAQGWLHAFQWDPAPGLKEWRGPLVYETRRKGAMPKYPEIDVDLRYRFSATEPFVIMQSSMTMLKDLSVSILRNGELVFPPHIFTHVACRDREGKLHVAEMVEGEEMDFPSKPDDPWLACYNPKTGFGMATIRLKVENKGPGDKEPVLVDYREPITLLSVNRGNYAFVHWARVLIWRKGKPIGAESVTVPAGSVYFEREAWLPFVLGEDPQGRPEKMLKPLEDVAQRLLNPLKVEVVK